MTRAKLLEIPEELREACIELTRLGQRFGWQWDLDARGGRCQVTLYPPDPNWKPRPEDTGQAVLPGVEL